MYGPSRVGHSNINPERTTKAALKSYFLYVRGRIENGVTIRGISEEKTKNTKNKMVRHSQRHNKTTGIYK